jgi:serine/threonine protein kinase
MNREMDIWGRLSHPHIVPLRGYAIEDDGTPELISPWFEHGDVLSYLTKFPSADRKKLVCQVADGLSYLHAQTPSPIVHGDLKGGNVLINRDGDGALCDFGLSKLLQDCPSMSRFTTSNAGVGTLRWCAPGRSHSRSTLRLF